MPRPEPLTPEWLQWMGSALAECRFDDSVDVILEHRVSQPDDTTFIWQVRLSGGMATVVEGPCDENLLSRAVSFRCSRETALAVCLQGASAQRAVLNGEMIVNGDARRLLNARGALEVLSEALSTTI